MPEYTVITANNERVVPADKQRRTENGDFLFLNGTSTIVGTVPVGNCEGVYLGGDS